MQIDGQLPQREVAQASMRDTLQAALRPLIDNQAGSPAAPALRKKEAKSGHAL